MMCNSPTQRHTPEGWNCEETYVQMPSRSTFQISTTTLAAGWTEGYDSPIGEAKMAGLPALNLAISVLKLRVHGVSGSDLSPETEYPNCVSLAGGGGWWFSQSVKANTSIIPQTGDDRSLPYIWNLYLLTAVLFGTNILSY